MLNPSPPKANDFQPFFCPAQHRVVTPTQYIVQLNPPFQFVGLLSANLMHTSHPYLHIHLYPKPGWPARYPKLIEKMQTELLHSLERLFPDLSPDIDAQVIDTRKTTEDLDPSLQFLFCESHAFGWAEDVIVHIQRPWKVFAVSQHQDVYQLYSETGHHHSTSPTSIALDPTIQDVSRHEAQAFYDRIIEELENSEPDDFID